MNISNNNNAKTGHSHTHIHTKTPGVTSSIKLATRVREQNLKPHAPLASPTKLTAVALWRPAGADAARARTRTHALKQTYNYVVYTNII